MRFGSRISGRRVIVPETLGFTKPGEIYEFEILTETPFSNDVETASQLMRLEQEISDLKVTYIETNPQEQKVVLQIKDAGPGSISLAGIVSAIPTIFIIIGIIVVGIITWQTLQTAPWLLWLGLLAGGAIMFYYFIGTKIPRPAQIRTETRSLVRDSGTIAAEMNLDNWRKSINAQRISAQESLNRARRELKAETKKKAKNRDTALIQELEDDVTKYKKELDTANEGLGEVAKQEKRLAELKIAKLKKK